MKQLGQGGGLVVHGPGHVVRVQVARDRVGREVLREGSPGHAIGETARSVADVEQDPARPGAGHGRVQTAGRAEDSALVRVEAVRNDVPLPQLAQQPGDGLAHVDDVHHQRQAKLPGGLAGQAQRRLRIVAHHLVAEPHLHADDQVRVLPGPRDSLVRRGPAQVLQLAYQAGDHPLHRDVEKREDAGVRGLDHVAAEPGEGLGAR